MSKKASYELSWRSLARRVARTVNAAWILHRLNPWLIGLSVLATCFVICLRTLAPDAVDRSMLLTVFPVLFIFSGCISWLTVRGAFIGEREGLVRLEDRLGLHNALSTADCGVAEWPPVPPVIPGNGDRSGLRWEWAWAALPTFFALFMVTAAVLVPIPNLRASVVALPPSEPGSWEQMEDWLETLQEEELIEEPVIEEYLEKITELRDQPEDDWFSHSSMEATDHLKESLQRDLKNLASDLGAAERDLTALENFSAEMSAEGKEMILKEYSGAVTSLTSGNLPLNESFRERLEALDPSELSRMTRNQLSKEQLESLKESLCQACQAIGGMQGLGEGREGTPAGETLEEMLARLAVEGKLGRGGINRGPGDAPLFFGEETDLKTRRIDGVENQDFSRVTPGDIIGTGRSEHEIDETPAKTQEGGAISSAGAGGETVWRDSLMPAEKAVLKKYFK